MPITTEYHVNLRYNMDARPAHEQAKRLEQQLHRTERASSAAGSSLRRLAGMAIAYVGFRKMSSSLLGFNSGLEQAKIQMAGLMEQAGRGTFNTNLADAARLVKQMQIDSRASVGTTQEFVQMASLLVQPLTMAGGRMADLRQMTRDSVVASKAMGIAAEVAARDVDQAIRGMYRSVDQFTGKLLTPLGYGGEEGRRKFNALSMQARFAEVQRALSSPAIKAMAKAQETSFAGVTSTMVDVIQMTLGRVGMPIFKRITAEVREWNKWLIENGAKVDHVADVVGGKLLQAAISFKNAISFAAEHWKSILATWGMLKGAGYLAGLSAAGGGLAGAAGKAGAAGAMGFGGKAAAVSIIASAVYIGATELAQWIDKRQSRGIVNAGMVGEGTMALYEGAARDYGQGRALKQMLISQGLASESGLNKKAFAEAVGADAAQQVKWARMMGLNPDRVMTSPEAIADVMARKFAQYLREDAEHAALNTDPLTLRGLTPFEMAKAAAKGTKVNVTIQRIEVASDDPDRFAMGFTEWVAAVARNPANAMHTIPEGT